MNSVQAEQNSARHVDELNTDFSSADTMLHETSSATALQDVLARLGGRFASEIADILEKSSDPQPEVSNLPCPKTKVVSNDLIQHQNFALQRIKARNVDGAVDYIQRHAPELSVWVQDQIKRIAPYALKRSTASYMEVRESHALHNEQITKSAPQSVLIDAEAGRIARILGHFGVFRAWAYAHSIDDGDGWIERQELETFWQDISVAKSKRHARRIIKQGIEKQYWMQDSITKRLYIRGQVKIAAQLVRQGISAGYYHLIATNKPGKKRVHVDLSGGIQEASANLYVAWHHAKDPDRKGTIISRDMLCDLWQISVPTLLKWEKISGVMKQANYAQSNDTSVDSVPAHAYLTLNRDGSYSTAWRLPNTYIITDKSVQQHDHVGKSTQARQVVRVEVALAEQRGSLGDAALPSSGKLYFDDDTSKSVDSFQACEKYLRKISRKGGDVFRSRYFYVGKRHKVNIYERYDVASNRQHTNIHQRLIWQEGSREFVGVCRQYKSALDALM